MLDANPIAIQQRYFTGNHDEDEDTKMFSIIEEGKETIFSQEFVRVF